MSHPHIKDFITGGIFAVLGFAAFLYIIPSGVVVPKSVNIVALSPDFWPKVIAGGVTISALFLIAESLLMRLPHPIEEEDVEGHEESEAQYQLDTLPGTLRMIILIGALFLFYFYLTTFGIVASSIVLMPAMMLFFGERKWRLIVPLSLFIPLGLYLFFLHIAGIPMPLGLFENLL